MQSEVKCERRPRLASTISTTIVDCLLLPLVVPAALLLKSVRRQGFHRLRLCRALLIRMGVLPIKKHYYEPFIDPRDLRYPLEKERSLPGIDWNLDAQLSLLGTLQHAHELGHIAAARADPEAFYLYNGTFQCGDAEFLYQLIRAKKPRRLIEIGSGNSTRIAREALARNRADDDRYECAHTCIEPFEARWLDGTPGITVLRRRVEDVDRSLFRELRADDLLFIDSSHVIRPQGDVLTEYLEILPTLEPGVIVHIHDIFSPRDYLRNIMLERMWLWNEQYLLEAFLTHNRDWQIVAALSFLQHRHFDELKRVCPFLTPSCKPSSFYIQRLGAPT